MSKSYNSCIFGCDTFGVPVHSFPNKKKRPEVLEKWLAIIPKKVTADDSRLRHLKVCDYHFKMEHRTRGHHITVDAIPSLYLKGVPKLSADFDREHNYCMPRTFHNILPSLPSSTVQEETGISSTNHKSQEPYNIQEVYVLTNLRYIQDVGVSLLIPKSEVCESTCDPLETCVSTDISCKLGERCVSTDKPCDPVESKSTDKPCDPVESKSTDKPCDPVESKSTVKPCDPSQNCVSTDIPCDLVENWEMSEVCDSIDIPWDMTEVCDSIDIPWDMTEVCESIPHDVSEVSVSPIPSNNDAPLPNADKTQPSKAICRVPANVPPKAIKDYQREIINLRKKIKRMQTREESLKMRLAKATKIAQSAVNMSNKMSEEARIFTRLQCRESGKKSKGRRFSEEEKILALSLMNKNPTGYSVLSEYFCLPSIRTLRPERRTWTKNRLNESTEQSGEKSSAIYDAFVAA